MSFERYGGLRSLIATEAARLMYEESVKQYFTAKRMAAKRLLGRVAGRRTRHRPADLPSNGEIRDALLALAELAEGNRRTRRLFAMRAVALETMRALGGFEPRLIGSVSTGHIRKGSDINLQVFTDDDGALETHLRMLGWVYEREPGPESSSTVRRRWPTQRRSGASEGPGCAPPLRVDQHGAQPDTAQQATLPTVREDVRDAPLVLLVA